MKKRSLIVFISLLLMFVFVGAVFAEGDKEVSVKKVKAKQDGPYTFGVSVGWIDNDFGLRMRNGFIETIEKIGNAEYIESVAMSNVQRQVSHIESFINSGVDAILISPYDTTAIQPLIIKAAEAGIPTFCCDTTTYDPMPTLAITSDNFTLGRETMTFLAEKMGGKGNLVVFSAPQHEGIRSRVQGVYSVLRNYPDIKVVATHAISWAVGDPTPLDAAQNILRAHPSGTIDAVWAPYDTAAAQISNATVQAGRDGEIIITGVDGDTQGLEYVNKGSNFIATAAQSPYWMAKTAVEMAYEYLKGNKIPRYITAPFVVATQEHNLQSNYDVDW